jgi:peptide-methionine (S)-S-oxide reductase
MRFSHLTGLALAGLLLGHDASAATLATAVFAGGCFWSAEHDIEHTPGVRDVVVGYAGGARARPTYDNHEGHLEAIRVTYDPAKISYRQLTAAFFRHIDPTDAGGQICDRGPSYRTAVFASSPQERADAEAAKAQVAATLRKPVATLILPAARFWPAEAYHQDYAARNPMAYSAYRIGCRRDAKLKAVWGGH